MSIRIVDVREVTKPIASAIRNAYIDFSKMTTSLVAVVTNVERNGRRVVGYGFNSNGRYGQGGLIRERFAPRLLEADPRSLLDATGDNLDPDRAWGTMMANEKPGGHGERSVAVGTLDMAVWDAVRSPRHRFRRQGGPVRRNEGAWRMTCMSQCIPTQKAPRWAGLCRAQRCGSRRHLLGLLHVFMLAFRLRCRRVGGRALRRIELLTRPLQLLGARPFEPVAELVTHRELLSTTEVAVSLDRLL